MTSGLTKFDFLSNGVLSPASEETHWFFYSYTLHISSRRRVGRSYSPESLTCVSSSGFVRLPPFCNSNYFGYTLYVVL
ncbi:hypothetical protein CKQ54_06800 [Rahnella variigena]|uniref:Uncharacterized protein n=1 Tax=Rahnella variigena TaxID=574964 RepID=A0ABX9PUU4_9GAMM|nr:hypothetical protein CKQ54_06800 [Rahnella variigena]